MTIGAGRCIGALLLALTLAGCASSPPTRFYLLSAQTATPVGPAVGFSVGVGPLELPAYLDRPQIVTRTAGQEVEVAEFERWAEPLQDGVQRVLVENLAAALPGERVQGWPWRRATAPDWQVELRLTHFEREAGGDAALAVRWRVLDREGRERVPLRATEHRAHPGGADYPDTVAALDRVLADFAAEIAATLRSLRKP